MPLGSSKKIAVKVAFRVPDTGIRTGFKRELLKTAGNLVSGSLFIFFEKNFDHISIGIGDKYKTASFTVSGTA